MSNLITNPPSSSTPKAVRLGTLEPGDQFTYPDSTDVWTVASLVNGYTGSGVVYATVDGVHISQRLGDIPVLPYPPVSPPKPHSVPYADIEPYTQTFVISPHSDSVYVKLKTGVAINITNGKGIALRSITPVYPVTPTGFELDYDTPTPPESVLAHQLAIGEHFTRVYPEDSDVIVYRRVYGGDGDHIAGRSIDDKHTTTVHRTNSVYRVTVPVQTIDDDLTLNRKPSAKSQTFGKGRQ